MAKTKRITKTKPDKSVKAAPISKTGSGTIDKEVDKTTSKPVTKPSGTPKAVKGKKAAPPRMRANSKQASVVAMLSKGASVAAIMKATGWQKHSVHGFFAGVVRKKLGMNLVSDGPDGKRIYRIAAGARSNADGNARRAR